jgi:hypothetical protein
MTGRLITMVSIGQPRKQHFGKHTSLINITILIEELSFRKVTFLNWGYDRMSQYFDT